MSKTNRDGLAAATAENNYPALDLLRIRARQERSKRFDALLHHLDVELLRAAYVWLKQEPAHDLDLRTWEEYGEKLQLRLVHLHSRIQQGVYEISRSHAHAFTVIRRRWRRRKVLFEERLVQRAVLEVLNAIYEQDFLDFSYGFRPGRGQSDALTALARGAANSAASWIVYVDTGRLFESLSCRWLLRCIEHRVADPRLLRLIRQWFKAGILRDQALKPLSVDVPRNALALLLANIYLHYVFDVWAVRWRQRHSRAQVILIRYAGDIVAAFERATDARRFIDDLRQRFVSFAPGLPLGKARLIEYDRAAWERRAMDQGAEVDTALWAEMNAAPNFRKGLAVLQRHSPFRIHSPDRSVPAVVRKGLYSLLGVSPAASPRK